MWRKDKKVLIADVEKKMCYLKVLEKASNNLRFGYVLEIKSIKAQTRDIVVDEMLCQDIFMGIIYRSSTVLCKFIKLLLKKYIFPKVFFFLL